MDRASLVVVKATQNKYTCIWRLQIVASSKCTKCEHQNSIHVWFINLQDVQNNLLHFLILYETHGHYITYFEGQYANRLAAPLLYRLSYPLINHTQKHKLIHDEHGSQDTNCPCPYRIFLMVNAEYNPYDRTAMESAQALDAEVH